MMKMKTLNQIASEYGICYNTLRKRLEEIPYFKLKFMANSQTIEKKRIRLLTISEVTLIYNQLGDPGAPI